MSVSDYKTYTFPELDSNSRLRETIFEVNRLTIWILTFVVLFYIVNTVFILKMEFDYGFYRLLLLMLSQVVGLKLLLGKNYRFLAFFNISIFYVLFFLYPFLDISRRFEENVYLPLVLMIFSMTLPILFYSTKKDLPMIIFWSALTFITVIGNLFFQHSIATQEELKFFILFERHPMTLVGFMFAILFLLILFYNYRKYTNDQHNQILVLNEKLNVKLLEIFEKGNEKETQNEELQSIQEELLTINEELEKKVEIRASELRAKQKEIVRYAFMNSHILRAPIARIKGLINLAENLTSATEKANVIDLIKQSINELDETSHSINEVIKDKKNDDLYVIEQKVEQLYGRL